MTWTPEKAERLKALAAARVPNKEIAAQLGCSLTDVYAKRSALGITMSKIEAQQSGNEPKKSAPSKTGNKEQLDGQELASLPDNPGNKAPLVKFEDEAPDGSGQELTARDYRCLYQHVISFWKQSGEEAPANFAKPCEECPLMPNCDMDWLKTVNKAELRMV